MTNPLIQLFRSKVYTAITLLITLLVIGVLGFKFMSHYSWVDALYMTVITITTVGFGEVQPLESTTASPRGVPGKGSGTSCGSLAD